MRPSFRVLLGSFLFFLLAFIVYSLSLQASPTGMVTYGETEKYRANITFDIIKDSTPPQCGFYGGEDPAALGVWVEPWFFARKRGTAGSYGNFTIALEEASGEGIPASGIMKLVCYDEHGVEVLNKSFLGHYLDSSVNVNVWSLFKGVVPSSTTVTCKVYDWSGNVGTCTSPQIKLKEVNDCSVTVRKGGGCRYTHTASLASYGFPEGVEAKDFDVSIGTGSCWDYDGHCVKTVFFENSGKSQKVYQASRSWWGDWSVDIWPCPDFVIKHVVWKGTDCKIDGSTCKATLQLEVDGC